VNGRVAALVLVAALAGCGGGGVGGTQSSTGSSLPPSGVGGGASIESTVTIPSASAAQSSERSAQYISPSTLGMKITITDVPPTGATASFTPITAVYTLQTGVNLLKIPTPATASGHSEDLTYVAYDAAPVSNAIPGSAKALAWGLTTGFVVLPGTNVNNPVLAGVVDRFPAPLAENGAFGMMSSAPPTLLGKQTSLGFGGATPANGTATMFDADLNNIATADGGAAWPVIGAVPTAATTTSTGVPVTIAETPGTCGSSGTAPHLTVGFAGSTPATTATISTTSGQLTADYDGNGGAGWYAIISAKGQTQTLTYTLSSLAVTSTNHDYNCSSQSLAFSSSSEGNSIMTIVEHVAPLPYVLTVSPTNCPNLANVYIGTTTNTQITPGTPTSLGLGVTTFLIQPVGSQTAKNPCLIEIQDAAAGSTGGTTFPGATTYVAVLPVGYNQQTTVP
jgi:hypothetical protein